MTEDTSPEMQQFYYEGLARLTPTQRTNIMGELNQIADQMRWSQIRRRFPDADEAELKYQFALAKFGPEVARLLRQPVAKERARASGQA